MNIEPITNFSGLPRVVDPSLRNHQWILGLSLAAGAVGFLSSLLVLGEGIVNALLLAVAFGISTFLVWVQSRELDPDFPISGLVGPVLVVPAMLSLGRPDLLAGFWVVLLLRILKRSTGLPAKPIDSLALLGLTGWLAYSSHPAFAVLAGLVLLADSWLVEGHPYHRWLGAVVVGAGAIYWYLTAAGLGLPIQASWLIGAGVGGAFYLLAVAFMEPVEASCDFVEKPISNQRERAAQLSALLFGLALLAFQGEAGLIGQLPLWSAMVGVAGFQIARKLSD